ncbi:unnamed protein product [Meganyctiphanes norvegica]|uniref:Uncharacterized protein n=1 Tax=Meganyctiphanes norvegica TaxID=48144 RepID=A0AAV2PPF1_MEGNR
MKAVSRGSKGESMVHNEFRLILTTEPVKQFPVSLLRSVEVVVVSAPSNAQNALYQTSNMLLTYSEDLPVELDPDSGNPTSDSLQRYRLLYGLAVFHTLVSERGRHGNSAWSTSPKFTLTDFSLAVNMVISSIEAEHNIDSSTLQYLIGEVIYGGRISCKEDHQILLSLLQEVLEVAVRGCEEGTPRDFIDEEEDNEETLSENKGNNQNILERLFPETFSNIEDIVEFAQSVPGLDDPEVFGLSRGAQRQQDVQQGYNMLKALNILDGTPGKEKTIKTNVIKELSLISEKVPKEVISDKELAVFHGADVIHQEVQEYNKIIRTVNNAIDAALHAAMGVGTFGGESEKILQSVDKGFTPQSWRSICHYPTNDVLHSFVKDLCERSAFFKGWFGKGIPSVIKLGCFQYLQAFLTSILRIASQSAGQPLQFFKWRFYLTHLKETDQQDSPLNDDKQIDKLETEEETEDQVISKVECENKSVENDEEEEECTNHKPDDGDKSSNLGDSGLNESDANSNDQNSCNVSEKIESSKIEELEDSQDGNQSVDLHEWNNLAANGFLVGDLWIVGAIWNQERQQLEEAPVQGIAYELPLLHMVPIDIPQCTTQLNKGSSTAPISRFNTITSTNVSEAQPQGEENSLYSEESIADLSDIDFNAIATNDNNYSSPELNQEYDCPVFKGGPSAGVREPVLVVPLAAGPPGSNHWLQRRVAIYMSQH